MFYLLTLGELAMSTLTTKDLPKVEELDDEAMNAINGGMMKLPFQRHSIGDLLTNGQGDPVTVIVDGLVVNSVSTGYAPK
jgi:hypothetical protein